MTKSLTYNSPIVISLWYFARCAVPKRTSARPYDRPCRAVSGAAYTSQSRCAGRQGTCPLLSRLGRFSHTQLLHRPYLNISRVNDTDYCLILIQHRTTFSVYAIQTSISNISAFLSYFLSFFLSFFLSLFMQLRIYLFVATSWAIPLYEPSHSQYSTYHCFIILLVESWL